MPALVIVHLLLLLFWPPTEGQQCTLEDWTSTFAIAGDSFSQCQNNVYYVDGLRSEGYGALVETGPGVIKAARCCSVNLPYSQEDKTCYRAQWWTALEKDDSWALCERKGYLLRGFFTIGRNFLADIGEGECCKPTSHPEEDGQCRDVNVDFTADGTKQCPDGMFLKGLYKTTCSTIDCLTRIRCCRMLPGRVNGGWSEWGDWSNCPISCGGGTQIRIRTCTNPPPSGGGNNCVGVPVERQRCNENACPVDGGWSDWSQWGTCTVRCGGGSQQHSRTCTNPPPSNGGAQCSGDRTESRECNNNPCTPVNGGWSQWSSWTDCTVNCGGGTRTKTRSCTNPPPANGGKDCKGKESTTEKCNQGKCKFSKWSRWGICDKTCGGGTKIRTRTCLSTPPCEGRTEKTKRCAKKKCPQKP